MPECEPTESELLDWYTCQRKCQHPDERAAHNAAARLGAFVMPYACPRCGGWHIGGPPPLRDVAVNAKRRRGRLLRRARVAWRKAELVAAVPETQANAEQGDGQ